MRHILVEMTVDDLDPLYEAWRALERANWQQYAETIGDLYDTLRETIIREEGEWAVEHVPKRT